MKNQLKNIHRESISLFVKINGIEQQVHIAPEQTINIDSYETKTMRVFAKRGFIIIQSTDDNLKLVSDSTNIESIDLENNIEVKSKEGEPTILEIIKGEVEQYIEGGFIKGEWTEEDLQFLKKNYPSKGRKYCSIHLNRNESSVQKKINSLSLKKKKKKK